MAGWNGGGHRIIIPMTYQQDITVTSMTRGGYGFRDGSAAQAQFSGAIALASMDDGSVLVVDMGNHRIRLISANGEHVRTVAGSVVGGHQDGPAAQARFNFPSGVVVLSGGRILIADRLNHRIRLISADLQQVSTVAGDGTQGHRDGCATQATFYCPRGLAMLPDGRVLVSQAHCIRVIGADLQ